MKAKVTFQVAATYVGAVMGAGFASGQEIQQFFANYGGWGLAGIFLSAGLFAVFGWMMMDLQAIWRVTTYSDFFRLLIGPTWGKRMDLFISVLLFVGLLAMLSGAGALFHQYFGLSSWVGVALTSVILILALWFRGEGVLWINSVLIPLKFVFCLGIAVLAIVMGSQGDGEGLSAAANPFMHNWVFSAILYVSFNLTLALVVFASLGKEVQKPGAKWGALLGGAALGLFAGAIGGALLRFPEVKGLEIPMVAVAGKLGEWTAFCYVLVLWLAMITAAIGNAFSLVTKLAETRRIPPRIAAFTLIFLAFPLAGVKFSVLVKVAYPVFGYLGLVLLPLLFFRWRQRRSN